MSAPIAWGGLLYNDVAIKRFRVPGNPALGDSGGIGELELRASGAEHGGGVTHHVALVAGCISRGAVGEDFG